MSAETGADSRPADDPSELPHALTVGLGARSYPVVVARDAWAALGERARALAPSGVVVVTDSNVATRHLPELLGALHDVALAPRATALVPAGERGETLSSVEVLYRVFLESGLDRKGLVVALGGGVVGDVAGFAAATWMRGVRVLHAPTTLLGMVDSAIGGKTGVDFEGKNLVGAFHQPSGVFASLDVLGTLPDRELRGGLGEVLKTAVLSGEDLFARLERDAGAVLSREPTTGHDVPAHAPWLAALEPIVRACAAHKAGVVERDEREDGERALLNLGHTLGHALEALDRFSGTLTHGEAVAVGLVFATRLSVRLGLLESKVQERIVALARALGLPTSSESFDPPAALELMRRDKKAQGGKLRFVLLRGLGDALVVGDVADSLVLAELAAFQPAREAGAADPLVRQAARAWAAGEPFWALPLVARIEERRAGGALGAAVAALRALVPSYLPNRSDWALELLAELERRTTAPSDASALEERARELWQSRGRDKVQTAISRLFAAGSQRARPGDAANEVVSAFSVLASAEHFEPEHLERLLAELGHFLGSRA